MIAPAAEFRCYVCEYPDAPRELVRVRRVPRSASAPWRVVGVCVDRAACAARVKPLAIVALAENQRRREAARPWWRKRS